MKDRKGKNVICMRCSHVVSFDDFMPTKPKRMCRWCALELRYMTLKELMRIDKRRVIDRKSKARKKRLALRVEEAVAG